MFAIAIWDGPRRRLVLARDRLGKKPLYWWTDGSTIRYASELKALLAPGDIPRILDRSSLAAYLRYGYVPAPATIIDGVSKLEPATVLVWEDGAVTTTRYWTPTFAQATATSLDESAEHALALLTEAVRIRLRSDVPFGVFLSGGIDSSIVTALMAKQTEGAVRTFSIGFEDRSLDELPYARQVSQHYGTDHVEAVVGLDVVELLPALAATFDEPFADGSAVPTYRVAQLASASLKVILTGDGGDEAFGGYDRYATVERLGWLERIPRRSTKAAALIADALEATRLSPRSSARARAASRLGGLSPGERYEAMMSIFSATEAVRFMGADARTADGYVAERFGPTEADIRDRARLADLLTYLPEDLLVKMDRTTMANSLEARSPLLDQEVVAFGSSLPIDHKIQGSTTKVLLRRVARDLIPGDLAVRRKQGFAVPMDDWFRHGLGDVFMQTVLASDAASRKHLDLAPAGQLLERHRRGAAENGKKLWTLLMFELWGRTWL
jgi:asparagine synthase (glutamine-hydrolysing)